MVLNVATVDPSVVAAPDRPTVVIVGGGDANGGGEAEIGRVALLNAVGVIDNNALVGVVRSDVGTGCIFGLNEGVGAAGGGCDGAGFPRILIGHRGVDAVIRAYEKNVGRTGILGVNSLAVGEILNDDGLGSGILEPGDLMPEAVVVRIVHAVNGEGETILKEVVKAVLINFLDAQSRFINGGDNFLLFIAGCC